MVDHSALDAGGTYSIVVTQKPRYVVQSLVSGASNSRALVVQTCCDRDNNASKTLGMTLDGTPTNYDTVGMKTDTRLLATGGVESVTDSAVTIGAHPSLASKIITSIYY